jgi:hypothetical protein
MCSITLQELEKKADLIVLGKVIKVEKQQEQDIVTIETASIFKGKSEKLHYTFVLISRGGLKDFDPALQKGDCAVFFLTQKDGEIQKAYWESVAVFSKNHFD